MANRFLLEFFMNETWKEFGCWLLPPPPPPAEMEVEASGDVPGFMGVGGRGGRVSILVQVIASIGRSKGIRDKVADWMGRRMQ